MGISLLKKMMFKVARFAGTNDGKQRTNEELIPVWFVEAGLNTQIKKSDQLTQIPTKQNGK